MTTRKATRKRPAGAPGNRDGEFNPDAFRRRMRSIGALLRDGLGFDSKPQPADVVNDAYLIVVSLIVETLQGAGAGALTTAELTTLSKALAEQRRLDLARMDIERKMGRESEDDDALDAAAQPLPKRFSRYVDQIYGTAPEAGNGETHEPPSNGKAD